MLFASLSMHDLENSFFFSEMKTGLQTHAYPIAGRAFDLAVHKHSSRVTIDINGLSGTLEYYRSLKNVHLLYFVSLKYVQGG